MKKQLITASILGIFLAGTVPLTMANTARDLPTQASDAAITGALKAQFMKDKLLNPFNITVTTRDGKVYLGGVVDTDIQYERAIALAESDDSVKDVDSSNLQVKNSQSAISDSVITAKIEGLLLKNKFFGNKDVSFWPVKIETKDGIVYLTGKVDNNNQKNNIITIAKSVNGVNDIKEDLSLNGDE